MSTSGLSHGVEVVLTAPSTSKPIWLKPNQRAQFKQLRSKFRAVIEITAEIEKFKARENLDDSNFIIHFKRADGVAREMHIRLLSACSALQDVCLDEGFNGEFLNNVSTFCRKSANNQDLQNKLESLQQQSQDRGINLHPTNITVDQIKSQLPVFDGVSSVTMVDALDSYKKRLGRAGIHKQLCGGVVLSKLEGPALAKIPPEVKREQNFEDIENYLKIFYQSSIEATKAIMKAHKAAIIISHSHGAPTAALKVLRAHAEVFENTDRFLQLTPESNAIATLTTGANVKKLLNLLPPGVRDFDNFSIVELDDDKRQSQYDVIRKWVNNSRQILLVQGTEIKDKNETHITLVTGLKEESSKGYTSTEQSKWNNGTRNQYNRSRNQFSKTDRSRQIIRRSPAPFAKL